MMKKQCPQENSQKSKTSECAQGLRKGGGSWKHRIRTDDHQGYKCKALTKAGSCPRCQGLMVHTYFMDSLDLRCLWGSGWRCINCGVIVDSVIIRNQEYSPPNKRSSRLHRLPK